MNVHMTYIKKKNLRLTQTLLTFLYQRNQTFCDKNSCYLFFFLWRGSLHLSNISTNYAFFSFWQRPCYSVEVLKKCACHFSSDLNFVEGKKIKSHLKFTFDICVHQRHWVCVISETGKTRANGDWQSVKRDPGGEVASDFQGLCLLIWSTSHGYLCGNEQPLSPGTFTGVLAPLQLCADMS